MLGYLNKCVQSQVAHSMTQSWQSKQNMNECKWMLELIDSTKKQVLKILNKMAQLLLIHFSTHNTVVAAEECLVASSSALQRSQAQACC